MMRLIWVEGRLSWPPVAGVLLFTLSLIVIDFAWRTVTLPLETLVILAATLELGLAFVFAIVVVFVQKRLRGIKPGP